MVNVFIHPENLGGTIAPDFLGLSCIGTDLVGTRFEGENSVLVRLFENLGTGTLRFGGDWLEKYTYWSRTTRVPRTLPNVTVIGEDLDRIFKFLQRTGWRLILGLNLGNFDPNMAADEAEYAVSHGGKSLLTLEIGNESNLYYENTRRPPTYTYANFLAEFEAYVRAIRVRVPKAPIAGPTTCCGSEWFPQFMTDEGSQLVLATHHIYPMWNDPSNPPGSETYPTIENMLSVPLMTRVTSTVDKLVKSAQSQNLPLQIDETNSSSGGGKAGVGDVFASALWGIDHMYSLAEHGVRGINFTTFDFNCSPGRYTPICLEGNSYIARPLYYGMLFFSQAAKGQLVPVDTQSSVNVTAHATLGEDGKLRLTLINKDRLQTDITTIKLGKPYARARTMRLIAPSLDSRTGITFGGHAVNNDGSWSPEPAESVIQDSDMFRMALPAGSAAVVIFESDRN